MRKLSHNFWPKNDSLRILTREAVDDLSGDKIMKPFLYPNTQMSFSQSKKKLFFGNDLGQEQRKFEKLEYCFRNFVFKCFGSKSEVLIQKTLLIDIWSDNRQEWSIRLLDRICLRLDPVLKVYQIEFVYIEED